MTLKMRWSICATFSLHIAVQQCTVASHFPLVSSEPALSLKQHIREQRNDPTLMPLFSKAMSEKDGQFSSQGYFVQDVVLMCKWGPFTAPAPVVRHVVNQIVVPDSFGFSSRPPFHETSGCH